MTCIINEFGVIAPGRILPPFTEDVLLGEVYVPIEPELTFYVRHGELFAHCSAGVALILLVFLGLRSLVRKRTADPRNDDLSE